MEVSEVARLADWFDREVPDVQTAYANLLGALQHNASQPQKRPLETELERLIGALAEMSFDELSLQQVRLLERLDVRAFFGSEGIDFINNTVTTANYDPATAVTRVQEATTALDAAKRAFDGYRGIAEQLRLQTDDVSPEQDQIIIRIGFEQQASIDNVADWKDSSKEWFEIIRGLALAANESPEDTKVLGAATGSVILILASTVAVTTMLAAISKNITSVAKDILGVGIVRENLRQKKLLTTGMEAEFTKLEQQKRTEAVKEVMGELKKHLHKAAMGDAKTALQSSVKKLLDFNEKGGVVDFVAPPEDETNDESENATDEKRKLLADARRIIHEYQGEREALRLLTHDSPTANDNDED